MTKLNDIQKALKAIDPGRFQKLGDLLLAREPRYKDLQSPGSVLGADKTAPGVPDSLAPLPDGGYAFAMYATEATHAKLVSKLTSDLKDCFDEAKTGIPAAEVREVFLCHTGRLSADEIAALVNEGKAKNCVVHLRDLHSFSFVLFEKAPGIAKDELGLTIDTGQILTPEEFVDRYGKSSLATRLNTAFHFREAELEQALSSLESRDLLLLAGRPGTGKTRLMLEVGKRFGERHVTFEVRSIFNRGANIFDDVRSSFSADGHYLILIDDANRLNATLSYFLQLFAEQTTTRRIKLVVTVRGYALDNVRDSLRQHGITEYGEITVEPFTDKQIQEFIAAEAQITNYQYLDRIIRIAKGNPRLAMMAAQLATTTQTLQSIDNAEQLYDEYFRSINRDLDLLSQADVIKVAGIVALLRVVDRSNDAVMSLISSAFEVAPDVFWSAAEVLHEREILDMHEEEVVRYSDQVLSTYLFGYAVFRRKLVPLAVIFTNLFPQHRALIIDALNPVLDAFGPSLMDDLRTEANILWAQAETSGDSEIIGEVIRLFWFIKQTETLVFLRDAISALDPEHIDIEAINFQGPSRAATFPFNMLGKFTMPDRLPIALELLCDFAQKRPSEIAGVLRILTDDFGFRPSSAGNAYAQQQTILDTLWERAHNGENLFLVRLYLEVAKAYLRTEQVFNTERERFVLTVTTMRLPHVPALAEMRRGVFGALRVLFARSSTRPLVLDFLERYERGGAFMAPPEVIAADATHLLPFIGEAFDPDDGRQVGIAKQYFALLGRAEIEVAAEIRQRFDTPASQLRTLLTPDESSVGSVTDWRETQRVQIGAYCQAFNIEDYLSFLAEAAAIQPGRGEYSRWQFDQSVVLVFDELAERRPNLFVEVIAAYLAQGNPLHLFGHQIVQHLLAQRGKVETEGLLRSQNFDGREQWLFMLYAVLRASEITAEDQRALLALYRSAPIEQIPADFSILEAYEQAIPGTVAAVVDTLVTREAENFNAARLLARLMNGTTSPGFLRSTLQAADSQQRQLLKAVYFAADAAEPHMDHDGVTFNAFLDIDSAFLREALERTFQKARNERYLSEYSDERNYDFLWCRDDYEAVIGSVVDEVFLLSSAENVHVSDYLKIFFGLRHLRPSSEPLLLARRLPFLQARLEEQAENSAYVLVLLSIFSDLPDDEKRQLVRVFVERNQRPEDFRHLPLVPPGRTWMGSLVPVLQREREFLESLLPLMNSVNLLEQRSYLEERIAGLRTWADQEKKRDFLNDL